MAVATCFGHASLSRRHRAAGRSVLHVSEQPWGDPRPPQTSGVLLRSAPCVLPPPRGTWCDKRQLRASPEDESGASPTCKLLLPRLRFRNGLPERRVGGVMPGQGPF